MRNVKKILVHQKSGKKFLVKDLEDNFHTQYGVIKSADFKLENVESSKGEKFSVIDVGFTDLWEELNRGPQVMLQKDIGLIIAKTGINKNSKIVDAGGGSGALSFSLANICKEITVYEINPEHFSILSKNKQLFGFKNINLKQDNIYEGIKEKNLDLINLDLPEPWRVTEHAEKALVKGGYLVVYLPNISQMKMFIDSCHRTNLKVLETIELLERKWKIEDRIMRPEFQMLGHTGFICFVRKL